MVETLFVLTFCGAIVLVIGYGLYLVFWQEVYDYQAEIHHYLRIRKLEFRKKWKPTEEDWKESPFDRPSDWNLTSTVFFVWGLRMSRSTSNTFWIIQTKDERRIWLEVKMGLWRKPILEFRKERNPPPKRSKAELIHKKNYECPACRYIVFNGEKECLDCGLNLS